MTNNNILFQKHCPSFLSFKATELFLDADIKNNYNNTPWISWFFLPRRIYETTKLLIPVSCATLVFCESQYWPALRHPNCSKKLGGSTTERDSDSFFTVPAYSWSSNNLFIKIPVRYNVNFYTHTQVIKHLNDFSGKDFNLFFP